MAKVRLDVLLVERGLAESRSQAQRLIMAGQVAVNGQPAVKPGAQVSPDAAVAVTRGPRFVSRGGEKLLAALEAFPIEVRGRVCADVGASTGGFTDCLLQHGAAKVYAIDVGKGVLHWKLRNDPRVVVMEGVNARHLARLPEPVDFVTVDASFISLKVLLPVVRGWFPSPYTPAPAGPPLPPLPMGEDGGTGEGREGVFLIKPQFEAGRREVARGKGVIRDPEVHRRVLTEMLTFAQTQGFAVRGLLRSPIRGPKGNVEFLAWLALGTPPATEAQIAAWVETAVETTKDG